MRTITTSNELDKLPRQSIIAALSKVCNVPLTLVWQRGSHNNYLSDWCTTDTEGAITSDDLFIFLRYNEIAPVLTVLWEPDLQDGPPDASR